MIEGLPRYPTYQDSGEPWLGEVPLHWGVRRLKAAAERIVGGSTPSTSVAEFWNGHINWVTPADVSRYPRLTTSLRKITAAGLRSCSAELVPAGSIVITARAPVGNVAITETEVSTNQGCKALVPSEGVLDSWYVFRVLSILKGEMQSRASGTTFTEISTGSLGSIRIPLPPLGEQAAIVRFLDHADRRIRRYIRAKQRLIALLEEQKQAIIHRAVTRGFDPDVRLKPSGVDWLGDIPEHWEVRRAKYLYREVDERSSTGSEELLSVSHLTGVTPRSEKSITMFMAESYEGHKVCRPADIVINTMWAWMGALGVARQVGIVSPSYGVYRPRGDSLHPEFVEHLLRTREYIGEYTARSTGITSSRLRLYPEAFLRIPLLVPPLQEQMAIADAIARETLKTSAAIDTARREIRLLDEYRSRLVAGAVTGSVDVRQLSQQLPETDATTQDGDVAFGDEELEAALEEALT